MLTAIVLTLYALYVGVLRLEFYKPSAGGASIRMVARDIKAWLARAGSRNLCLESGRLEAGSLRSS